MKKIYYNADEDQIYILNSSVAWTEIHGAHVLVLFCPDCNFWHFMGYL